MGLPKSMTNSSSSAASSEDINSALSQSLTLSATNPRQTTPVAARTRQKLISKSVVDKPSFFVPISSLELLESPDSLLESVEVQGAISSSQDESGWSVVVSKQSCRSRCKGKVRGCVLSSLPSPQLQRIRSESPPREGLPKSPFRFVTVPIVNKSPFVSPTKTFKEALSSGNRVGQSVTLPESSLFSSDGSDSDCSNNSFTSDEEYVPVIAQQQVEVAVVHCRPI